MPDQTPYSKREIDTLHGQLGEKIDALDTKIVEGFKGVHERQDIANTKIKKIIVALVLVFGIMIGLGATNFTSIVRIFF